MTSPLENKLNASMQSPRRRSTSKVEAAPEGKTSSSPATSSKAAKSEAVADLNAGTGRELNPERIWPD
ncbi:MAG: hypothetical protein U7M05_08930 [Candidatus Igneacidithiobacillus chanchocoensis]